MAAWAPGAWAPGAWASTAWAESATVTVPDVVGLTQAAGTAVLSGAGFVTAVVYVLSTTVPAGTIISQSPVGGSPSYAGATVTITVSSGDIAGDEELIARWPNVRIRGLHHGKKDEDTSEADSVLPVLARAILEPDPGIPAPALPDLTQAQADVAALQQAKATEDARQLDIARRIAKREADRKARTEAKLAKFAEQATAGGAVAATASTGGIQSASDIENHVQILELFNIVLKEQTAILLAAFDGLKRELATVRANLEHEHKARALEAKNRLRAQEIANKLLGD